MKNNLRLRSRGEFVKVLQFRLGELGYDIEADGYFGPMTERIVKQYQRDNGLSVDGIVGPNTWSHIEKAFLDEDEPVNWDAPTGRDLTGSLKKGMRGEYVRLMQEMLKELGYLIVPDGSFGVGTDRVVRQFQRDSDLIIDGIIGANTLQTMSDYYYYPHPSHPIPRHGKIDRDYFFRGIRSQGLYNRLKTEEIGGMNLILSEWEKSAFRDLRWLAYMMATIYHETNRTFLPVREAYWLSEDYRRRNFRYYPYYGRGYVQLTWKDNYRKMGNLLGIDLVNNPDKAMDPVIALKVLFEGMTAGKSRRGDFGGRAEKLEDYFTSSREEWRYARKIINGTDAMNTIASYGRRFHQSLRNAPASA